MIEVRNGSLTTSQNRKRRRGRRRNGIVSASTRTTTLAGAKSFASKNGLKLVSSKAVANGRRRKRRRRNGIGVKTRTASNGIFGNTKTDAKKVLSLLGGAIVTNLGGNTAASLLAPYLSSFGIGNYAGVLSQTIVAIFGVPYVANAMAGKDAASMARLGGLLAVALDLLSMFFPQFNSLNPFNTSAVIVNPNGQVTVTPAAAAQIATAASEETAAKIAGYMRALENSGGGGYSGGGYVSSGMNPLDLNATM